MMNPEGGQRRSRIYIAEQSALVIGGHYHAYSQTVARAAVAEGLDVVILHNRAFAGDWQVPGAIAIPAFDYTWSQADRHWQRRWDRGNFAHDYHQAVRAEPPRAGDHVLFSTLGYAELEQLLAYFAHLPPGVDYPFVHLLLRYDPEVLRTHLGLFRPLFDRISASPLLCRHVRFHSDTDILAREFAALSGLEFSVLPIPFEQDRLRLRLREDREPGAQLTIGYLGDARIEKNYADIPDAVAYLWKDYLKTERARFVLQSNFNIPGGEAGILQATQRLGQYGTDKVEQLPDALDGDAYYDRLADADLVIIPYDPVRYRGRSSGILIEAKAAGKPIVTTRGSWMETQVTSEHAVLYEGRDQLGPAIRQAIDTFPQLAAGARRIAPAMMDSSSGAHFVRSLLATTANVVGNVSAATPRVLIVVDGDTLVQRNGAGVTALTQLLYLRDAGYRVTAVFLMNKRDWDVARIEAWAAQLLDRIAPLDLAAAFLVGTGRMSLDMLRQKALRVAHESSILADLEQVVAFDASLDLVAHLRETKFDLVWLNYVMNAPLLRQLGVEHIPTICETHDIQSFQKAIYGARRVDPAELRAELVMLARFDHLISVSAAETEFLKTHLPEARVTTTGIFPQLSPPAAWSLAGARTLDEVVASCGRPVKAVAADPGRAATPSRELAPLATLTQINLLYVSSNHLANVSGLRWFLDEVYLPILAPAGISLVVAGSIAEATNWPSSRHLYFLGRLESLAPLYAAAQVIVLPVLEGAGIAVKTIEALSYGKAIVASPLALRGVDARIEGVAVAETADAFAAAIVDLLGSETLRHARGAAARESAARLADPTRYATSLNAVFREMLGGRARTVERTMALAPEPSVIAEWDESVMHANILIRAWLEGSALDGGSLAQLAALPVDRLGGLLRILCEAMFVVKTAPILVQRGHLRSAIAAHEADAHKVANVLAAAVALYASDDRRTDCGKSSTLLFDRSLPLAIYLDSAPTEGVLATFSDQVIVPDGPGPLHGLARPPEDEQRPGLVVAELRVENDAVMGWSCAQYGVLDAARRPGGQLVRVVPVGRGTHMMLIPGMSFQLAAPSLLAPAEADYWLDLLVDPGLVIEVREAGRPLDGHISSLDDVDVLRFRLASDHHSSRPFQRLITVIVVAGSGLLQSVIARLVSSHDPARILDLVDFFEGRSRPRPDAAIEDASLFRPADIRAARQITEVMRDGRPLPRARLQSFRDRIDEGAGLEANLGGIAAAANLAQVDMMPLLDATGALGEQRCGYVASSGISVAIEARLRDAAEHGHVSCLVDGRPAQANRVQGGLLSWQVSGDRGLGAKSWRHAVQLRGEGGAPAEHDMLDIVLRLPAGRDASTGDRFLSLTNVHALEQDAGLCWTWTGGDQETMLVVPFALTAAGKLRVELISIGENHDDGDLGLTINGLPLPVELRSDNGRFILEASFPAEDRPLATTEIAIGVGKHFTPPADPRSLGVSIATIELRLKL